MNIYKLYYSNKSTDSFKTFMSEQHFGEMLNRFSFENINTTTFDNSLKNNT